MIDKRKRDEVLRWLKKALSNMRAAKLLAHSEAAIFDIAAYHCQQTAEKALKGFLIFHGLKVAKIHNVLSLWKQTARIAPGYYSWADAADRLTPLAFLFRYPGAELEPDTEIAQEAIEDSETIF